jgi:hypothetical protein
VTSGAVDEFVPARHQFLPRAMKCRVSVPVLESEKQHKHGDRSTGQDCKCSCYWPRRRSSNGPCDATHKRDGQRDEHQSQQAIGLPRCRWWRQQARQIGSPGKVGHQTA